MGAGEGKGIKVGRWVPFGLKALGDGVSLAIQLNSENSECDGIGGDGVADGFPGLEHGRADAEEIFDLAGVFLS